MKTRVLVLSATALCLLLPACGDSSAAPTEKALPVLAQEDIAAVWPEDGSKVFETFDIVVGLGEMKVDGRVAIIEDGDAVPAGDPVEGDNVTLFDVGENHGSVTLKEGGRNVTVQITDETGKSLGPNLATKVKYVVVANPSESPRVWFIEPKDGAKVGTKFHVKFGVAGMGMSEALKNVKDKTVGHHHILVKKDPMFPSQVIPNDGTHIHYGKAQTETDLELEPGKYTLTMQFADGNHRSYGKRMSHRINITVE